MKKQFFAALITLLSLSAAPSSAATADQGTDPEIKVVVTPKRVWVLTDETPGLNLHVQIQDKRGKVVAEKKFTPSMTDWSLDVEALATGSYTIYVGKLKVKEFNR